MVGEFRESLLVGRMIKSSLKRMSGYKSLDSDS